MGNTAIEHMKLREPQNLWAILFGTNQNLLIVKRRRRFPFRTTDLLRRKHGTEILAVAHFVTLNCYDTLLEQKYFDAVCTVHHLTICI